MIGRGLIVHCPNHPEAVKYLSTAEEFDSRPEGGCGIPCMFLLKCGHRCQLSCHGYDVRHEKYECKLPCLKSCIEEHQCPMMCYEACQCQVRVIKTLPLCGHKLEIPCCLSLESVICPEQCFKTLPCGHPCAGSCNECVSYQKHMVCYFTVDYIYRPCNHVGPKLCCLTETDLKCQNKCSGQLSCGHLCSGKCSDCVSSNKHKECLTEVEYIHQSCGHAFRLPCCKSFTNMNCTEPCKATLNCGHQCKGTCSDCLQGLVHQACNESCRHLPLPCGHPCQGYCSTPCLPCKLPCPFKCRHRSCTNKQVQKSCGEPCTPCRSECMQECKHLVNLKYCSENWDNDPCSEMCTKRLKSYVPGRNGQEGKLCFHPCRGICGEICVCSQCEKVNCIKKKEASIDKPEGPILKLPLCRHNFYVSELDKYVKGHNQSESNYILCPLCTKPLLNCLRYDTINQQRFEIREQRKRELIQRNDITSDLEDKLERSRNILRLLEDYKHFERDNNSSMKFSNQCEFLSKSIKYKFIYAVAKLKVDLKEGQQLDLINILKKSTRFSQQSEMEMNQEITRRMYLNALNFLKNNCSKQNIQIFLPKVDEIQNDLNKSPTKPEVLERAHEMISLLRLKEEKSELNEFYAKYTEILQVIQSRTEETLVDIMYPDLSNTNTASKQDSLPQPHDNDFLRDPKEIVEEEKTQPELSGEIRKQRKTLTRDNVIQK